MTRTLNNFQPFASLLLRLTLGAALAFHGYQKVVPHGALVHFEQYVHSLGMPAWMGMVSAFTELCGGILLILGLLTRFAAFMVAGNMMVAVVKVTLPHGYAAAEYPLALLAIAIALVFYGAGALALDKRIGFN